MNRLDLPLYIAISLIVLGGSRPSWAQADNPLLYELLDRIELLEREVRQLRGDLEILQHQRQQQEPPASLHTPPPGLPPLNAPTTVPQPQSPIAPQMTTPTLAPPDASAQNAYDSAFNHLRDSQYEQSIAGFEDFLRRYPNNTLSADAYYWLGESYYVTRRFEQARQMYLQLGADYPNSPKLPDAMLKLGYIYSETGDTGKAREMLQKLIQVYPNSIPASLGQAHLNSLQ